MIETIRNAWKIPELRKKILFTVFALLIFRLGSAVPVPFINGEQLGATLNSMGGIFALLGTMNGTAFSMAAVFAEGGRRGGPKEDRGHHPLCHSGHRSGAGLRLLHSD